jgi:hypothetical protein
VKKSPESVAEAHGTAGAFRLKSGGDCWFGFWVEGAGFYVTGEAE